MASKLAVLLVVGVLLCAGDSLAKRGKGSRGRGGHGSKGRDGHDPVAQQQKTGGANCKSVEKYACRTEWFDNDLPVTEEGVTCAEGVSCELGPLVMPDADGIQKLLTFCNEAPNFDLEVPFTGVLARACRISEVGDEEGAGQLLLEQPCRSGADACRVGPLPTFFNDAPVDAYFCLEEGSHSKSSKSSKSGKSGRSRKFGKSGKSRREKKPTEGEVDPVDPVDPVAPVDPVDP